ncbi:MAG: T9SS type A sorting domain-containing protein [Flavobacteriales bacterium]|nr:T9SS type A sorting domain-containing protein [Flavobacteriales bacterium]
MGIGIREANQRAGDDLLSAYPNPFTERTTLRYTSHGGRVLIQVFNEQGQLLQTAVNQPTAPGTYTVDVDLGPLPSGVYYARFQNEGSQQVRNLLKVQ